MTLKATLDGTVAAEVTELRGEFVTLRSPQALAPGQPACLELMLPDEQPLTLRVKCRGSTRNDDGHFTVTVRLVTIRRSERAALIEAFR